MEAFPVDFSTTVTWDQYFERLAMGFGVEMMAEVWAWRSGDLNAEGAEYTEREEHNSRAPRESLRAESTRKIDPTPERL